MKGISSFRNHKKLKKRPSTSVMVAQEISGKAAISNGEPDVALEIVIREFLENFDKESEDSNILNFEFLEIRKEQTSFQVKEEFRSSVGQKIAHFVRNRYRDILPYDKTRVLLSASPDNTDGYINASHISHPVTSSKYIAAQAPLSSTVEDFWQMAFEQNANVVGMLCKCVENGMAKCEKYWGDDEASSAVCDNVSVHTIEEKAFEDFVYRKLKVKSEKYGITDKVIHQLHYTEWPDHGCPNGEKNVLEFMEVLNKLRSEDSNSKGPLLLHCSAGCGRTGSVIAIDIFRDLITSKKLTEINLKQLVLELRKQRVCMVQTPGQYQFLHKCIAHYCKQYLGLITKNIVESTSTTNEDSSNGLFSGKELPDEKVADLKATAETEQHAVDVRF